MVALRSLALGMTGAWNMLVAYKPIEVRVVTPPPVCPNPAPAPTVVDVAHGFDPARVPLLVHVDRDEQIQYVDGVQVDTPIEAAVAIADAARTRSWIDIDVQTTDGPRRVFVLLH